MRRLLIETMEFLFVLGVLQLARLLVIVFCIGEIVMVIAFWGVAVAQWQKDYNGKWFLMPVVIMVFVVVQVALWQFTGCASRSGVTIGERWPNVFRGWFATRLCDRRIHGNE